MDVIVIINVDDFLIIVWSESYNTLCVILFSKRSSSGIWFECFMLCSCNLAYVECFLLFLLGENDNSLIGLSSV